jgi:orotate phosphoribosyltransferase
MKPYQEEFLRVAAERAMLGFGEFVLKSGRKRCLAALVAT